MTFYEAFIGVLGGLIHVLEVFGAIDTESDITLHGALNVLKIGVESRNQNDAHDSSGGADNNGDEGDPPKLILLGTNQFLLQVHFRIFTNAKFIFIVDSLSLYYFITLYHIKRSIRYGCWGGMRKISWMGRKGEKNSSTKKILSV